MKLLHTGIVVRDRGTSIAFYRDVVDLTLLRELERRGPDIDQVVGYEQTHLRSALLELGDGKYCTSEAKTIDGLHTSNIICVSVAADAAAGSASSPR